MTRSVAPALVALCLWLGGCTDEEGGGSDCEPMQTVSCSCGGAMGTAVCNGDREPGPCSCPDTPTDGGLDSSSDPVLADGAVSAPEAATGHRDASLADASSQDGAAGEPGSSSSFPPSDPGQAGPYATVTENNVGPGNAFTLVRPRDLGARGEKHPVITWGNGTGAMPTAYRTLLNRLASHGFVVVASNSTNTGTGNEMLQGVDWVLAQNDSAGNALSGKIDPANVGATGHSQGGFGTCATTRDARIKTIAPLQGFRAPQGNYQGSTFAVAGKLDNIVTPASIEGAFDRVRQGPAMYGELAIADHVNWLFGSAEATATMNAAVVSWMRVHLMSDTSLRARFYGGSCGYCTDSAWRVVQKGMP